MACFRCAILKCVFGTALFLSLSSNAFAIVVYLKLPRAEPGRAVSSLQVVGFLDSKYENKGRRIGFKKVKKRGFPDCYIARVMTHVGEIDIVNLNCK